MVQKALNLSHLSHSHKAGVDVTLWKKKLVFPKGKMKNDTFLRGKIRKTGYMDWVCKVSKSELLMTLPNAEGKLKPFPFEFCLCGNILSKGVAYRPLQLDTVECEHTHKIQGIDTCSNIHTSTHTNAHTHRVIWLLIGINQKDFMHYMRGVKGTGGIKT